MLSDTTLEVGLEPRAGYRLRQLRGQGSFGCVWETETDTGTTVALKFLSCADSVGTRLEMRALQQVAQLHHPNLLAIDAVWCYQNFVVASMALGEGSLLDLYDAYRAEFNAPIAADQVCLYLADAARGIDFMNKHQHQVDSRKVGFQHCDIKPSNLLLFGDSVKVSDFGLTTSTSAAVKFHRPVGTPEYSAPEVFFGRLSDWTDQYSLAMTYCHLRGGRLPFNDQANAYTQSFFRLHPDLSMLSEKEKPIVARALSVVPQNRWPSCVDLMQKLSEVAG